MIVWKLQYASCDRRKILETGHFTCKRWVRFVPNWEFRLIKDSYHPCIDLNYVHRREWNSSGRPTFRTNFVCPNQTVNFVHNKSAMFTIDDVMIDGLLIGCHWKFTTLVSYILSSYYFSHLRLLDFVKIKGRIS